MIRPPADDELPALARGLAALPLMTRYGRDEAKLLRSLRGAAGRGERLLVAFDDVAIAAASAGTAEPRGLAWLLPAGTLGMGGYLKLIAVLPGARGSGAGAALLAAFEAEAARASAHAFLLVSDFNTPAQRFYEKHGYARVGALPGLVLPDVAELLYWKRLR